MTTNDDRRQVGELWIKIDRDLCCGFGDCVDDAPEAFELDRENVVMFVDPASIEPELLIEACRVCPVEALSVWDSEGTELLP